MSAIGGRKTLQAQWSAPKGALFLCQVQVSGVNITPGTFLIPCVSSFFKWVNHSFRLKEGILIDLSVNLSVCDVCLVLGHYYHIPKWYLVNRLMIGQMQTIHKRCDLS